MIIWGATCLCNVVPNKATGQLAVQCLAWGQYHSHYLYQFSWIKSCPLNEKNTPAERKAQKKRVIRTERRRSSVHFSWVEVGVLVQISKVSTIALVSVSDRYWIDVTNNFVSVSRSYFPVRLANIEACKFLWKQHLHAHFAPLPPLPCSGARCAVTWLSSAEQTQVGCSGKEHNGSRKEGHHGDILWLHVGVRIRHRHHLVSISSLRQKAKNVK